LKREAKQLAIDHTIDTTLLRYQIGGRVWRKLPCYIGWLHARVKPDGRVLPCNSYGVPMGNLNKAALKDIWNGRGYRRFRRQAMTRRGLAAIAARFDCYFCCHVADNLRVYRVYRWMSPFAKTLRWNPKVSG
jgi:radical SAM protein with 4Fe4S-binding SPASM domain